jgi:hypothetical protein
MCQFEIILKQLDTITERIEGIEDQQGVSKEEETPEETLEILQDDMDELTDILDEVERKASWTG